jgi:hypothetical protein
MFLSTRQMRRFAELVADVIDDMLAADFEDGFAVEDDFSYELPIVDDRAGLALAAGDWPRPATGGREPAPIPSWDRRHARPATAAAARAQQRRRPGQVDAAPTPCSAPLRRSAA